MLYFIDKYGTIKDGMYHFESITNIVRHQGDLLHEVPVALHEHPLDREGRRALTLNTLALSLLPPVEVSNQAELVSRQAAVTSVEQIITLTEDKNHQQQRAEIDSLTGTRSQSEFKEQFPLYIKDAHLAKKPLVYAFVDLDNFKQLNDTSGHDAGDRLLAKVGETLLRITRACDFVARDGGDEFKLLFPDYGNERSYTGTELLESMDRLGLKIRQIINDAIRNEPYVPTDLHIGASLGIGMLAANEDVQTFAERIETDMYNDKKRRKAFMNR